MTARRNTREYSISPSVPFYEEKTSHGPITQHVGIILIATPPWRLPAPLRRRQRRTSGARPTPSTAQARIPPPAPSGIRRPRPCRRRLAIRVTCSHRVDTASSPTPTTYRLPVSPHPTRPDPVQNEQRADERDRGQGGSGNG